MSWWNNATKGLWLLEVKDALLAFYARAQQQGIEHVVVGFSAGQDSTVLLHALKHTLPQGMQLGAVHCHHGLQSAAEGFELQATQTCKQWGIPLTVTYLQVSCKARQSVEEQARLARLEYWCQVGGKGTVIVLAHHLQDQAETVLMQLLRGSGVAGLSGAHPWLALPAGGVLARPLLSVSKGAIRAYAAGQGLVYSEDPMNEEARFTRTWVRHTVLPILEARYPQTTAVLGRVSEHASETLQLLEEIAQLDYTIINQEGGLNLKRFKQLSLARQKNLLRYWLKTLNIRQFNTARFNEFVRQLNTAGPDKHPSLQTPKGTLRVQKGRLCFWQKDIIIPAQL